MRISTQRRRPARRRPGLLASSLLAIAAFSSVSEAVKFTPAPPANIDFTRLGRIGVAGDFTGLSLYQFEEQNELPFSTNGSEALLTTLPNGVFASLVSTDASIHSMCSFTMSNGVMAGVVIGGNFTSLNGSQSQAIAMFNPNTTEITPLAGLEGQVNAVFCDKDTNTVYVGGNFRGADSTNAIAWYGTDGWTNLPFAGFNGPVTSITRASNGHIIFGGSFTGLGNASDPTSPDGQIVNLATATITSGSGSTAAGFNNPRSIICRSDPAADSSGGTWLLQDNSPGSWQASFGFGFRPTKLRLYNTRQDGRGTKTWRFTVIPDGGILNFTYVDPATGQNASCTNQCPLSNDPRVPFQDFHFVNSVGMNAFRIDISEFFGRGGGLNGIQLYEDDIFAYAVNQFNEPESCGIGTPSRSQFTGPWTTSAASDTNSRYLTAAIPAPVTEGSASVVFQPDIKESGNYSVNMYTPGCIQDNSCSFRGQIKITGQMAPNNRVSFETSIFQTNNFDKYDQIYFGFIESSQNGFRPTVTITPLAGQSLRQMTMVAQRVGFTLLNSTGGLNGLYDYDPKAGELKVEDFKNSAINRLGFQFSGGSAVSSLVSSGDTIYVGGNFSSPDVQNVIAINSRDERTIPLDGGLNGEVNSMQLDGNNLYVGGQFSDTRNSEVPGLNNVGVYDTSRDVWGALGAGVNGKVLHVVPVQLNLTTRDRPEVVIAFTGDFTECVAFGGSPATSAPGLAVWVPSRGNWLQNLETPAPGYSGILTTGALSLPGGGSLYAGSVSSAQLSANSVSTLSDGSLGRFPVKIQPVSSTDQQQLTRRDSLSNATISGVATGTFAESNGRNVTILAGHFTAQSSNGTVNNLVIIDGADGNRVSGLGSGIDEDSTFVSVAVQGDTLFAGGTVTGTVNGLPINGLVTYNLASKSFPTQPPSVAPQNSSVSAIAVRPNTGDVYVGGSFQLAGSLPCPAVCFYSTERSQWNQPGINLQGSVDTMMWASEKLLVAGGALTVNQTVNTSLAVYDIDRLTWDKYPGAEALPGPVEVLNLGSSDGKQLWAAGHAAGGSLYIMKYDGSTWRAAPQGLLAGTVIRSLQVFSLTRGHGSTDLLPDRQSLVLVGSIILPNFGTASAAIFDGKTYRPYALSTNSGNTAGEIARIFSQNQDFFTSGGNMRLVFIVLIGLAISLGLILLIVAAGVFLDRLRKKREGIAPATFMLARSSGIQRIPPAELLESLGQGRAGAPHV